MKNDRETGRSGDFNLGMKRLSLPVVVWGTGLVIDADFAHDDYPGMLRHLCKSFVVGIRQSFGDISWMHSYAGKNFGVPLRHFNDFFRVLDGNPGGDDIADSSFDSTIDDFSVFRLIVLMDVGVGVD